MKNIELEILGLSSALSSSNNTYALILKEINGLRRLPVIIGAFEAQAIALELENFKRLRPLTHDLFYDVIIKLGAAVQKIVIDDIKDGIFYATIFIRQNDGKILELDARPSDAVAIAVRFRCPIFATHNVMDEASVLVNEEQQEEDKLTEQKQNVPSTPQNTPPKSTENLQQKIESLISQIEEAILNEDYETAAKLRDEIKRLESQQDK